MLCQSYENFELLVVDDSSDGCAKGVCEEFNDERVEYLRNQYTKGACGSRNTGIARARGIYYAGLDDDDVFYRDRLSVLLGVYRRSYAFVCSNIVRIGDAERRSLYRGDLQIGLKEILWSNCVGNQILSELSKVRFVGGFNERLEAGQDRDLWVRMIERWGKGLRISSCLYGLDVDHGRSRISERIPVARRERDFLRIHGHKLTPAQRIIEHARIRKHNGEPHTLGALSALRFPGTWEFLYKRKTRLW